MCVCVRIHVCAGAVECPKTCVYMSVSEPTVCLSVSIHVCHLYEFVPVSGVCVCVCVCVKKEGERERETEGSRKGSKVAVVTVNIINVSYCFHK
jgi:hypothetical protein